LTRPSRTHRVDPFATTYRDPGISRWDDLFDRAVESASRRRLAETLTLVNQARSWQRRQSPEINTNWHRAELLWLEGVILERARRRTQAARVWTKLATFFERHFRRTEFWMLPTCRRCAGRKLDFAPNWFTAAHRLRAVSPDVVDMSELLSTVARENPLTGGE
jgi:hypothetical protein